MKHLILCREYPPACYPPGGIGTYVRHIGRLLAEAGETVHIIAQRWDGAPEPVTRSCEGRLTVHRIPLDEPIRPYNDASAESEILRGLAESTCPSQVFSWQAAKYAESLIEEQEIDVIEAQEWEAPLYYLQLRRRLGLGPDRQPPCIVHLHSPTQMIFEHNEWDTTLVDYLPLSQLEEFTIRAADSLICPSHYLAYGVAALFGLEPRSVTIVRHPMGETPVLTRAPEVWARNAICYVGRLELRKGIIEWIDAGIQVAAMNHGVSFDFFGSDTSLDGSSGESVLDYLKRRIPRSLRPRFRFHGTQSREQLVQSLSSCSIAVVPSRWENFPYTCIEAMATGLPVLVSPNGGMAELIDDGYSGWVARDGSPEGLAEALTHALSIPAAERAAMGARATEAVRRLCANEVVIRQHLEHRSEVVRAGSKRFIAPAALCPGQPAAAGMGFVVTCAESPERMHATLASILLQTQIVPCVIVLDAGMREQSGAEAYAVDQIIYIQNFSPSVAARRGFDALLTLRPDLEAVTILNQTMRLAPSFAAACGTAFLYRTSVGLIVPWVSQDGRRCLIETGPIPLAAPILCQDNLPYGCAIRVKAVRSGDGVTATQCEPLCRDIYNGRPELSVSESHRWEAVTYPATLMSVEEPDGAGKQPRRRYSVMALIQNPSTGFALARFIASPVREKATWIIRLALHPGRIIRWLAWQVRRKAPKFVAAGSPRHARAATVDRSTEYE